MKNKELDKPDSYLKIFSSTFIVAALGYFVDVYDLVLFGVVRVPSLKGIFVADNELMNVGVYLINCQMTGIILGGILWGILGDKRGRISVLLGSIFLYSIANILNAFVTNVEQYAFLRFIAGLGLAGEVGAAITLVSEILSPKTRGIGTAILSAFGILGAVVSGLVSDLMTWKTAYLVGGCMGMFLLVMRMTVSESGLYEAIKSRTNLRRGDLRILFSSRKRFIKYLQVILVGIPIWYIIGIIITFSPEISRSLGMKDPVSAGKSIMYCYVGLCVGDLLSGLFSQIFKNRRKIIFYFLIAALALATWILFSRNLNVTQFYFFCTLLGFTAGYWSVFITMVAETFGTNIRATVTITVTNFVRGSVILLTFFLQALKEHLSLEFSAWLVGVMVFALSIFSLSRLVETFGKNLDFVE